MVDKRDGQRAEGLIRDDAADARTVDTYVEDLEEVYEQHLARHERPLDDQAIDDELFAKRGNASAGGNSSLSLDDT